MLMSQEVKKQYSKISVSIYMWQKLKTIQILSIFILQISHTVGDTEEIDPFFSRQQSLEPMLLSLASSGCNQLLISVADSPAHVLHSVIYIGDKVLNTLF